MLHQVNIEADVIRARQHAKQTGLSLPLAAKDLHQSNINNPVYWCEPKEIDELAGEYQQVDLISDPGWYSELARSIAGQIQFPASTAFLHGLAVLSAVTSRNFRYEYYGKQHACNLYAVTAQPPSSGKSGINEFYIGPAQIETARINRKNAPRRSQLKKELKELYQRQEENGDVSIEIEQTEDELKSIAAVKIAFDDITPEAAESEAFRQNGLVNIVSAESDAINIILGSVYGGDRKANHGLFLKAWDTEWHSSSRVTRDAASGEVYGSLAVIAQMEAVKSILQAGMSGRGISERILLLCERPIMGNRNFNDFNPVSRELKDKYHQMIASIIDSGHVTLKIGESAMKVITKFRMEVEPELSDQGKYSNSMLRGVVGKSDKQIIKIACLLHITENWCPGGAKKVVVDQQTVTRALKIFKELLKTYMQAADSSGFAGFNSEVEYIIERLKKYAEDRKMCITIRQLKDNCKGRGPLANIGSLQSKLVSEYLPFIENAGFIVMDAGKIYINPRIK